MEKIKYYEFATRKIIYCLLIKNKILDIPQINYLLEREKHSFCKQILIAGILQYYDCSREQVEKYLKNKSGIVRRRALEYQFSIVKNYWDGLEMMLLDKNKGVRELTAYIIRHHSNIHILNFYIEHLQDENPIPAIVGIGEHGNKDTKEWLLPFLHSPIHKVVCTTLRALAKAIGMEGYDIYSQYLESKESTISKAAYYAIRYSTIHYGAEKLYHYCIQYEYPNVKKYALLLLLQENSWNRLPFLLNLYGEAAFEKYQHLILGAIETRDMYGKISKQQEEKIYRILEEKENLLSVELVKEILFDMKFLVEK